MSNVKTTCFRFNLDNPEHARAWTYLKQLDKSVFKSCNDTVIKAVNDYFERYFKTVDDPYFENRQREDRFVEQIVSEVGKSLVSEMPKFLASFMLSLNTSYSVQAPAQNTVNEADNTEDSYEDYIDTDFLGG
ncbi:MAG: hypothetical protein IJ071_06540 [Ruminococcus sp.]|nr:hypothetical protein [Ruminococcus sp.]